MDKYPNVRKCLVIGTILLFVGVTIVQNINANMPISDDIKSGTSASNIITYNGTLSGYVTDSMMNPIEGARVRVYFHNTSRENYSDVNGYFHVTDISICNCTKNATCSKEGYYPVWVYLGIWENTTYDFVLKSKGDWLYVGGSGPGNYTRIQDAINDSHDGDTVFVYSGLYSERIVIPKAIDLIGESKNTTIIDTKTSEDEVGISLISNNITISGFTLLDSGENYSFIISNAPYYAEIRNITISDNIFMGIDNDVIRFYGCDFCTITQNTFDSNYSLNIDLMFASHCNISNNLMKSGERISQNIYLLYVSDSRISNNTIISSYEGLTIVQSYSTIISNNYFFDNLKAIYMEGYSSDNSIISNVIDNPLRSILDNFQENIGILLTDDNYNTRIEKNVISHYRIGIIVEDSYFSNISMNTFMKNIANARFNNKRASYTTWNQNYWGRSRILPTPIFGIENYYQVFPDFIQFDRHPALKPYDIPGMK
jgi:parallel beta-helix repeat protein